MRAAAAALTLACAATPLAARGILLNPPIDCDLGTECFIQQYVDHDRSNGAMDFRCESLSYDTHQGTDFALRTLEQMRTGVNVIAAAPGTVRATRDGMEDRLYRPADATRIDGRECGNGVVVDHGGGWTTQYCHLKQGTVAVSKGDKVRKSTVLGQVGLSGRTQFPHVHLTLRKDGAVVDPFEPDGAISCEAPSTQTLWQFPLPYRPGGVLDVGFATGVPDYSAVKAGTAGSADLPTNAPALVVFGYAFGGQDGDVLRLELTGPDGVVVADDIALDRNQAQFFRAIGKKRRSAPWPAGTYTGVATLRRGTRIIDSRTGTVTLR